MSKGKSTVGTVSNKGKGGKGIPRITNKVIAGGDALVKFNEAVAKLTPAQQAECKARLEAAIAAGPRVRMGSVEKLTKAVETLKVKLADAEKALATAQEKLALNAISGIAEQERIIEKANKVLAQLKAAREAKAAVQA